MSEEQSPLIGQEIGGKFRVLKLLGEGGMGAVYLGEQKLGSTLRKVAIKTLHPHLSHDPKIKQRFERECSTVAELQHPNTIQIYDFGETPDGTLYIVMEYVEGRSVAEILEKEGPMDPGRVTKIMTQVCGSLEEAHGRGIVHRDLKPDNVVLCERAGQKDWVEVLDFGIAKRSNEQDPNEQKLTQQGMVLGTPPYMSPEQFTGKPIDARSDIYSLGVMAYEMLTGRLPFSGNTAWEWATQHMTARPVAIESLPIGTRVPPAMRAAINRALAKTPEERFSTVKEFIDGFSGDGLAAQSSLAPAETGGGRQKTEMATPMQAPYAAPMPGPGPQMAPPMMSPTPAPQYGTPASGNQAFAAAQTAQTEKKGPPRGIIFGAIGVLGVGSVVLVLAGLGVFSGKKTDPGNANLLGTTTTPATTQVVPTETTPQPTAPATTETTTQGTVAPLTNDPKKPPSTGHTTKPTTSTAPATSTQPATSTTTAQTQTAPPSTQTTPPKPPQTQTPPPPKPPIPECNEARTFCNHPAIKVDKTMQALCAQKKQACFAKGGNL